MKIKILLEKKINNTSHQIEMVINTLNLYLFGGPEKDRFDYVTQRGR